jgi:hypothetical protein
MEKFFRIAECNPALLVTTLALEPWYHRFDMANSIFFFFYFDFYTYVLYLQTHILLFLQVGEELWSLSAILSLCAIMV